MSFGTRLVVSTLDLDWQRDPSSDTERKPLDELTGVVRIASNGELSFDETNGEEGFVLDGSVLVRNDELVAGSYFRFPAGTAPVLRSERGCTFFLKRQPFASGDVELVIQRTRETPWLPGQGRLEVMPLHEHQGRSTALVKWPAGEKFVPHRHWGGEEIFVLSGTFMDEHGVYPAGCWLRNPHLSQHHPFVEEETIILVKVGHLA